MKRIIFSSLVLTILLTSCDEDPRILNPVTNVDSPIVSNITGTTAEVKVFYQSIDINGDGKTEYRYGACWDIAPQPTILDSEHTEGVITEHSWRDASFTIALENLKAGTTYYLRPYAIDSTERSFVYGKEVTFTTLSIFEPTIEVAQCDYSYNTATFYFQSLDKGNDPNATWGVYYGTTPNPTTAIETDTDYVCIENLVPNTKYYYRAFVKNETKLVCNDESSFTTYPEYVDLGLSVKWSALNVGAHSGNLLGNYYAWGETTTKKVYSSATYELFFGKKLDSGVIDYLLRKYCFNEYHALYRPDRKLTLELSDDAAYLNQSTNAHIPTKEQLEELVSSCSFQEGEQNGCVGYIVTSNINQKSIFLPAAGYYTESLRQPCFEEGCYYWSNTVYYNQDQKAWALYRSPSESKFYVSTTLFRTDGLPIRAVYE